MDPVFTDPEVLGAVGLVMVLMVAMVHGQRAIDRFKYSDFYARHFGPVRRHN